jgi:hypothetical protein
MEHTAKNAFQAYSQKLSQASFYTHTEKKNKKTIFYFSQYLVHNYALIDPAEYPSKRSGREGLWIDKPVKVFKLK